MLASGPAHGYDICRRLQTELGAVWNLGRSQIYALLAKLERDGLVVHERVGQENLPAKNIFSLTSSGEEVFGKWLRMPVNHVRDMRLEFLTKLWFARQADPVEEQRLIEKQLTLCREKAHVVMSRKDSCRNQIEFQSLDFRLAVIQAAISWLEGLLETSDPRVHGCPAEEKEMRRKRK